MERESQSVNPSVEEVMEDEVPQPALHFVIHVYVCFHEVPRPPPVNSREYFRNLGFVDGCRTLTYVSDKKAKYPGKSLYTLARSWFMEAVTEKDKSVSTDMRKKARFDNSDDDELKGYLKELVEQAKAAKILARMARKKRKTVQKQVSSTSAPCCGKKKSAQKMRSLNDILRAIDQEGGN